MMLLCLALLDDVKIQSAREDVAHFIKSMQSVGGTTMLLTNISWPVKPLLIGCLLVNPDRALCYFTCNRLVHVLKVHSVTVSGMIHKWVQICRQVV